MTAIAVYKFEHSLLGTLGLALLASYKNHGNYWRAESHFLLSGQADSRISELLKFEHSPPDDGLVPITDEFMIQLALDYAKAKFSEHAGNLPELRQKLWSEATVTPASSEDLLQAWIRQKFPNLHHCANQTECEELRQHVQAITKFSPIKASWL